MSNDIHFLPSVRGKILDLYLAKGWYRTACYLFTTHTIEPYNNEISYPVIWLRYKVASVKLSTANRQLIRKNKHFKVIVRPFSITDELVGLHKKYIANLKFQASQSLQDLLVDVGNVIFESYVIEVRDEEKLIAAGIFDKGLHAIAGIVNCYDPDYKKHSLGRFLIMLKYSYCVVHKIPLYYPGYYSPEYPVFDYKLTLDKAATEIYIPDTDTWQPYLSENE